METIGYIIRWKWDKQPRLRRDMYPSNKDTPETLLTKARIYKTKSIAEAYCKSREEEVVKIKIEVINE